MGLQCARVSGSRSLFILNFGVWGVLGGLGAGARGPYLTN